MKRLLLGARYWAGTKREELDPYRAFRRAARRATSPAEMVDRAFRPIRDVGIGPVQIHSELVAFISIVRDLRPRYVLEVGTCKGGTLYLLAWASSDQARILSLDIQAYERKLHRFFTSFARDGQKVDVWRADSHSTETRDAVAAFFGSNPIDVLFVDGDHSYEGVSRDFELYYPLVRPGGLVAFHDIVDGHPDSVGDVPRFWREVRARLDDPRELVESWQQGGFGIGVGRAVR